MVDLRDLLYFGSVMISLNEDGELIGRAMIELENGYIPLTLSSIDLNFIELEEDIKVKLQEGYILYMIAGQIYLGKPLNDVDKSVVWENDIEFLSTFHSFQNLEYQQEINIGKKRTKVRIGNFCQPDTFA